MSDRIPIRPYVAWGRHQFRIGWRILRPDRPTDEYHFIGIEWHI